MPKVPVTCQECGKEFEANQSDIKRGGGKYCSIECAGKSRIGEKNHKWKPKVKHICEECGKEFEVKPYQTKNGSRKYCSHECSEKAHSGEKNPNWKPKIKRICGECGEEFEVSPYVIKDNKGGKYCSKSCRYKARSRLYTGTNSPSWKPKIKRVCMECGKEFEIRPGQAKIGEGKYCSRICLAKAQSKIVGENHHSWKGGMKKWICEQCGEEFTSRKKSPRFCSKECKNRNQSIHNLGANNPFYKGKIKRNCQNCGKEFEVPPNVVEHGHGKFCSKECMITRVTKKCEECGKEITVKASSLKKGFGRYCSKACQGKARSKIYVGENHPNYKGKVPIVCKTCKKTFYVNQGRASVAKYCSMKCTKKKIKRNCLFCGNEFEITPSKIRGNRGYYCSKICYYQDRTNRFSGEDNPSFKGKIKRICERCGKEFEVIPSLADKGFGKYCSKKCFYGERIKKVCRFCGKEFEKPQSGSSSVYCSRECQSNYWEKERIKRTCLKCGKEFEVSPYVIKRHGRGNYCSRACKEDDQLAEKHPSWKGGLSYERYCPKFNNKFRERVRKWFDYQCVECGQPQDKKKLQIHHVYYFKKSCCEQNENGEYIYNIDNEPFKVVGNPIKFVALCNSCHMKTNHNRLYWARYFEDIINNWYDGRSWID